VIPLWPRIFGTPGPKTCWRSQRRRWDRPTKKTGGLLASEAGGDRGFTSAENRDLHCCRPSLEPAVLAGRGHRQASG
jgi:hypothetical protein